MTANDECEKCREKREYAEYVSRFDFRDGRAAWVDYEKHRRECHHVLHVAIPKEAQQHETHR